MFYKIINDIDTYTNKDEKDFYQFVDQLYKDILDLQLILVDKNREEGKYSQSHLITFALAAYCDERLNIIAISSGYDYEMLQTRLFKTLDAGKVYYQYLEYLISQKSQAYTNIYWVYYYLLNHGYKGMYDSDSFFERSLYLRQLKILILDYTPSKISISKSFKFKSQLRTASSRLLSFIKLTPVISLIFSYLIINYL
ncbi:DotU family type IV/VI secretion system protein [Francisella sp. 19S2-4]|nr:DotU family type IV/VI secretion system protein [Francisella sp. 19S2-4]